MPLPYGSYIVFGQRLPFDAAPQVHMLVDKEMAAFQDGRAIAENSSNPELYMQQTFRQFFRMPDADTAIPAWSREALVMIAQGYEGAHQIAVRGIAAAIALDRPYSRDKDPKSDGDGGTKVADPIPPKKPQGGDTVKPSAFRALMTKAPA
jgi:hypothetical protein